MSGSLLAVVIADALLCAIVGALISQSKGRGAAEGVIVGGLLGLIGLILLLLVSSRAPAGAPGRVCPRCAERIQAAAVMCRFCGATLEPIAAGPAPAASETAAGGLSTFSKVLVVLVLAALVVLVVQMQAAPH